MKNNFITTFLAIAVCALALSGCESEFEQTEITVTTAETENVATELEKTSDEEETTTEQTSETTEVTTVNPYIRLVAGFYINIASPYEQWHFYEDGRFYYAGQELTYDVHKQDGSYYVTVSNGNEYTVIGGDADLLLINTKNGETIELYEEGSDEVIGAREKQRLYSENAELFDKFPDEYGWLESCQYGDIPDLADAEYIEKSLAEGIFLVSNPVELASFNYIVNTSMYGQAVFMQLQNDIDLSGYNWAPMGWTSGNIDLPFTCVVNGNGFTVKNMTINCYGSSVGFIGWENYCSVYDITFENAYVEGRNMVGIIAGQAIGGWYENCSVSGEVNGSSAGSMIGHDASSAIVNCTADVIVNGEQFDFLTYNDKAKSEIVIENPVEITIDDTYTVTRPEVEDYTNLGWMVYKDGIQVLHRNAENELSYQYFVKDPGKYEIYLTAWVEGQYMPISNVIEYTIE